MKMTTRKIGMAALLGLMSLLAFTAPPVLAGPCDSGTLIDWDADAFAYETNYAFLSSSPGSVLSMVGVINLFCAPLNGLNPLDPNKEYTFHFTGLTSAGTQIIPLGPVTIYATDYGTGSFSIYEGTPRNAPLATTPMPANPPNALVPSRFTDGTVILSGTLSNLHTDVQIGAASGGSFRGDYTFTGGSLYALVQNTTPSGVFGGLWCAPITPDGTICDVEPGYSAHVDGKFDVSAATPASSTTWGAIKSLYR
jgi:hypothetical protein